MTTHTFNILTSVGMIALVVFFLGVGVRVGSEAAKSRKLTNGVLLGLHATSRRSVENTQLQP